MIRRLLLLLLICFCFAVQGFGQCTLSVSVSASSAVICSGNSVTLTATATAGTAPYTYVWSTGETTASIKVNKGGTYTVTVSDKTAGCQPVKKSISVSDAATPAAPTVKNVVVCPNTSATLTATAPGGVYQWYDAATGGNFLATGASYTTPPVTSNSVFYVETTVGSCTSPRTAVYVSLPARPKVQGATICSGDIATVSASGGDSYAWYSSASGGTLLSTGSSYTTPPLTATTTYYVVVTNNGCSSNPTAVTVQVVPAPQQPTASNVSVCFGQSANLHASAPSGVFNWYSTATGGTPLISSPDYTTPKLTATTSYWVSTANGSCESNRTQVTVTVNSLPAAPARQSDTTCYQSSITLVAGNTPGITYQWYDSAAGTNLLATGPNYTTPVLSNSTTYYVKANNGGCESALTPINVIVKPQLAAPSAAGAIVCYNSGATLTATATGGTFQWYDAATGGNLLASSPGFTTPALTANTTYYVQNTQNGCVSPRTAVTVTVLGAVPPPSASGVTICAGNTAMLSASGSSGRYEWYDSSTGGTLLSQNQVFITPNLTTSTTYYVEGVQNGCESTRTAVTVTVTPEPADPTANGTTVCPGTSASLTASTTSGTIRWYDSASGGKLLASGNTYNTPPLSAPTTYYVESVSGQCTSNRIAVTVNVGTKYSPQFEYPSGTFCTSSPNVSPVINNPNGGVFSASPAGLVFVSNTTGEINISASTPGKYTISFVGNGNCAGTSTETIAISNSSDASFSYQGPYCQTGTNPFPTFAGLGSAGSFTAAPAGLVFVNKSSGEIDLAKSKPGTYTVTNTIGSTGGCPPAQFSNTVTIDPAVFVNAGPDQTVATGTPVQLAGSITGASSSGTWTGGTGTFSNPSQPHAIYTPGPGETSATLTLTSTDPPGACGIQSAKMTITFTTQPAAPTVQNVSTCNGSSATLSATAPGGTYNWYDAPTGGNLLATGPNFTTPPLTANTTYYVQTTVNGITSNRTAATVTVNTIPAAPVAPGQQVCSGSSTMLKATGSTGVYEWYDAATGGNLLAVDSVYTTPALIANTSYYVQADNNGCISPRTEVDLTVTTPPNVTSAATGSVCSGSALGYTITADQPSATFSWSRAQAAGISNPAVSNQTTALINDTLVNTTGSPVNVTYVITPLSGSCAGPTFNYVVTVFPAPMVTSADSVTICNGTTDNYTVTFNTPVSGFTWSRDTVPGIKNAAVSGQNATTIKEVLFNTTSAPIPVTYTFNYQTSTCNGLPFSMVTTVNPQATVTSAASGTACSGYPQAYDITSNIPSATFTWSRNAVNGISNPAVTNQSSSTINETLENTTGSPINVVYTITPMAYGCTGTPFRYTVSVNPPIKTPVANSNSPVCTGSTIRLNTAAVPNAAYLWTGPNGFSSTLQDPTIPNVTAANSGTYILSVTIRGCTSAQDSVSVNVDAPPVADAGPDQVVCIASPSVYLNGKVTGGTSTGIWTTAGSGTFSPSSNVLDAQYLPSQADKNAGSVKLTLTSTSKDDCQLSTSTMTVTFGPLPAVNAGPDQEVCNQTTSVPINGNVTISGGGTWSTSGTGTFSPSAGQLNTNYIPSAQDIKNGAVMLTLTANSAGVCYLPSDSMKISFIPPPTVYAGGIRYVLKGRTITLYPTVSNDSVTYLWSPNLDINDPTLKNPVITGDVDRVYTLTVTDTRGCVSQDTTLIKVSPIVKIYNTFTPNGDGVNDYWNITGLIAYTDATVDIYDRYGQRVFHSLGYPKPWDGTLNGKALPAGVYYYVIDTHLYNQVFSGYVTLIR